MNNPFLQSREARDIDRAVEKVLRDLGRPEPPLDLANVRRLLRLDRAYYSSASDGVLRETIHRLTIAGKQVLERPSLLLDAIRKFDLRALWLPDRKRILIDSTTPTLKQRWDETHEIGHSLIPWHEPLMHGDQYLTLSISCHEQVEAEANYAAGRLLFMQGRFHEELRSRKFKFSTVQELHELFGNTITSTLWRAVESSELPTFGLVSIHPQKNVKEGTPLIRHFLRSPSFAQRFKDVAASEIFLALRGFCFGTRGLIGQDDIILADAANVRHRFSVECFHNSYDALTLGVYQGIKAPVIASV